MNHNEQADKTMRFFCRNWQRLAKKYTKRKRARWLRKKAKHALRNGDEMPLQNRYDGWVT